MKIKDFNNIKMIETANLTFASQVFVVPKKGNEFRMLVDKPEENIIRFTSFKKNVELMILEIIKTEVKSIKEEEIINQIKFIDVEVDHISNERIIMLVLLQKQFIMT